MRIKSNSLLVWDFGRFENEFWGASWHLFAGRPVLTYDIYIEFLLTKKTKTTTTKNKRRNLMSTLEFRDVLDGISEACSMIVYFLHIWNLTWINIWRIEETTKYCESNWKNLLLPFFLYMEACMRCDVFLCNFGISLDWVFCISLSQSCF